MAMDGENHDSNLLDLKFSPLLLFDYDYYELREDGEDDEDASVEDDDADQEDDDDDTDQEDEDADETETEDDGERSDGGDEAKTQDAEATLFFYSITKRLLLGKRVDDLKDHFYWITPHGWLLMLHPGSHQTFLWNPFTRQRISLPLDQQGFLAKSPVRCLLSHRPSDPNCVVLALSTTDTILWYCHPGGDHWFEHEYQPTTLGESRRGTVLRAMAILTAVGGKFCTSLIDRIVTLEFLPNPVFTTTPVEYASDTGYSYIFSHVRLLESCGDLFKLSFGHSAICYDKVVHTQVHKLDLSTSAWVNVDTLGDRVFFVSSDQSGASRSAQEVGLKGNCIYFLWCHDKALYVHNMERGTTAIHNPGLLLPDDMAPKIMMPPS